MNTLIVSVRREFLLVLRSKLDIFHPLAVFLLLCSILAAAVHFSDADSAVYAPAIIWILTVCVNVLAFEKFFEADAIDGNLDLQIAYHAPLLLFVLGRVTVRWLTVAVPICAVAPLAAWLMNLDSDTWTILSISLLLGSPSIAMFSGLGAALSVGLERGGVFLALLTLPLTVPVLLLGIGACRQHTLGIDVLAPVLWLLVILIASVFFIPFGMAKLLQVSQEY